MMKKFRPASACWCAACLAVVLAATAAFPRTLEIPSEEVERVEAEAEEIRAIADQIDVDFSNPQAMLESFEGMARTDMAEASGLGWTRDAVWGMELSGSWSASIEGTGRIIHWDMRELSGTQILHTQLEDGRREAPLLLGVIAPKTVGVHDDTGDGNVGIDAVDNHYFEDERVFGYARDGESLSTPGFAGLDDIVEEFEQTRFEGTRIQVLEAAEDEDGDTGWRLRWTALLQEQDQFGNPTGMSSRARGWMCDAASYDDDPEACEREAFEVVDVSPPPNRENVNPELEHIEVTFTHPADLDSLAEGAELFTKHVGGARIDLEGAWERAGQSTYRFVLEEPLRDGVQYDIHLPGEATAADPVEARDTDEALYASKDWSFTTLLNLVEQDIDQYLDGNWSYYAGRFLSRGEPVVIDGFQVLENIPMTAGKPAMSRVRLDWEPHDDIKDAYQPDSFEMTIELTPEHSVVRGQKDIALSEGEDGPVTRIFRQDEFSDEEIRVAHHSINAFGWTPQRGDDNELSVTLAPENPYPHPLPEAEYTARQGVEIWDEDPGDLKFHYAVMDLKGWDDDITRPWNRPRPFSDIMSLFDSDGSVPDEVYSKIDRVVGRVETYVPQFMPYLGARGMDTGFRGDRKDISLSLFADPVRGLRAGVRLGDACSIVELHSTGSSDGKCLANSIGASAYMVWLQNKYKELIDPEDFFVLFVPQGFLGPGSVGHAPMFRDKGVHSGMHDFRARSIIVEIDYDNDPETRYSSDELALTVLHEFTHMLGLNHNPGHSGDVPDSTGYFHDGIEGFRMDPDGLGGRNKSTVEGNEESRDTLLPLMWPSISPSRDIMTAPEEYEKLQDAIAAGRTLSQ